MPEHAAAAYDYVIVGSGAGGGTLAARLAEHGMRVLVLEAGGDPRQAGEGMPEDYDVPAFHPLASEHPGIAWDFFVRHYADTAQAQRDPKSTPDGILYPRTGTLGGCTAHNAMILIRPHDSDWDGIAELTGDASWRAARMRRYWRRLEDCRHRPAWRLLRHLGLDPTGHGWNGWLSTERATPTAAMKDDELLRTVRDSAFGAVHARPGVLASLRRLFEAQADPNDIRFAGTAGAGICFTPLTTRGHQRTGARERLLATAQRHPDRLHIALHALAAGVIFDDSNRAIGVEYLNGARLYRASPEPGAAAGERQTALARREVILAGGAFNTPQLLMLSGIGPRVALAPHGIPVRVELPGVGRNLQDRYEIGVVFRMSRPWRALEGARFDRTDRLYREWARRRSGMYVSNGAALAVVLASSPAERVPDLFCMALLARFAGYVPGYSRDIAAHHDRLSWTVLKAHTNNRAGEITLRSADPRDPPEINFRYFGEGDDRAGEDLRAVIAGIRFIRRMSETLRRDGVIAEEELPGPDISTEAGLADYVRDTAWGHHASCSAAIGPRESGGVLDSEFRVHGTQGLRVVDASAFPRIPGFFIASAVYMLAEKAADAILGGSTGGGKKA